MDVLNQLVAFLGTINPWYAVIGGALLFVFRNKLPAITLPTLGGTPVVVPAPAPGVPVAPATPSATPVLDFLKTFLASKFTALVDSGVAEHDAAIHLAGTIQSAGVKVPDPSVPTLTR